MNNNLSEDITELLLKKRDLVEEMYLMTESTRFYGDEEDPNKYIKLIEKRQRNIEEIISINDKLKEEPYLKLLNSPTKKLEGNIYSINHAIKTAAEKILQLDKKNVKLVEKIMLNLKKEIKGIKNAKNMNSLYHNDSYLHGGNYFDKKK